MTATTTTPGVVTSRTRRALLFAGLMIGLFISELDQTVFATALPTVAGDLGTVEALLWVNTAYVLPATVILPVYGKLGDLLGQREVFAAGLAVFVVGSVVGALAPTLPWLIAARVIQGLGGGGLIVGVQAIVAQVVPPRERARTLSVVSAVFAVSALLGPVLGGWLTDGPGWRWAFWVNVPLGALAVVAALALLPRTGRKPVRLDIAGTLTLTAAVTALVLLSTYAGRGPSTLVVGLAVVAAGAGVAFVLVERRAREPVVPLHLLRERNVSVPTFAGLVLAVAMFGTVNYLPTFLQMVDGLRPTVAGIAMLALVAGIGLATVGSAQVVARTGRYRALPVVGALLAAAGLGGLATLRVETPLPVTCAYLVVLGAGIGCAWQILVVVVQDAVPAEQVGTATGLTNFFREVGVTLGTALVGALLTARLAATLGERLGRDLDPGTVTPGRLAALSPEQRAGVATAYADALTPVFAWLVPVTLLSAAALLCVRGRRLAEK